MVLELARRPLKTNTNEQTMGGERALTQAAPSIARCGPLGPSPVFAETKHTPFDKSRNRAIIFNQLNGLKMRQKSDGHKRQADLIGAMAHPTRLRILEILGERGECCVCHLTAILKQRQPYVSQQLMVLRNKGLVSDRKDGVMVYYRLVDPRIRDLILLTRDLLPDAEARAVFPAVPKSPVPGCPCPECEAA